AENSSLPVAASQTRTASSTPAAARHVPSGLKATAATSKFNLSPKDAVSFPVAGSRSATPYSPPRARRLPSGLKATANVRQRERKVTARSARPVAASQILTCPCGPSFSRASLHEARDLPSGDQATP